MTRRIYKSRRAERDLHEQAAFIARRRPRAAIRFLEAAEQTFDDLGRTPELGGAWETADPDLAGIRVWPIRRFRKHLIFYRTVEDGIEIVRVLHGSRDIDKILGSQT